LASHEGADYARFLADHGPVDEPAKLLPWTNDLLYWLKAQGFAP
jgi:hypothetical protein